mmetsp:Transcript_20573/g.38357  ORF Transcript_20573/g.38357 Transcript_20573/m.38357 type:complete len:106 (+) Transcript_20573:577-894(+)
MAVGRHHGQVDEDARQVEQASEPGGDENDVEGFDPEHAAIMGSRCGPMRGAAGDTVRNRKHRTGEKKPRSRPGPRKPYRCHHAKAPAQGGKAGNDHLAAIIRSRV